MPTESDLLPPNATPAERALSRVMARIGDVSIPHRSLWNPATCPAELLPWLAWGLSIDRWRSDWSEAQKRLEVARAIDLQRRKGTPASVEQVLASFDPLIRMAEWFEMDPPGTPHTFEVVIPLDGEPLPRSTAEFARELVRDIYRIKPARSHFELWLELAAEASMFLTGGAFAMVYRRLAMTLDVDEVELALMTEDGLSILTEDDDVIGVG